MTNKMSIAQTKNPRYRYLMKTPHEIIDYIGPANIAERLAIGPDAIRRALNFGLLPAAWYDALENMAGRPLPRDCFTFKGRKT